MQQLLDGGNVEVKRNAQAAATTTQRNNKIAVQFKNPSSFPTSTTMEVEDVSSLQRSDEGKGYGEDNQAMEDGEEVNSPTGQTGNMKSNNNPLVYTENGVLIMSGAYVEVCFRWCCGTPPPNIISSVRSLFSLIRHTSHCC